MRKWTKLMLVAALSTGCLLAEQWTGWVADQKCAKAGNFTGAQHQKCVSEGQPVVFVNEADKKIFLVNDQEKLKELVGKKVTLNGEMKSGTIEVASAAAAE